MQETSNVDLSRPTFHLFCLCICNCSLYCIMMLQSPICIPLHVWFASVLDPSRSVYFCAIPSSSPVQNELYLATPDFSLFVLELPLPKRKAEVKIHYSFWNFRSQNEKRKLNSTICFETFVPRLKRESRLSKTNCR